MPLHLHHNFSTPAFGETILSASMTFDEMFRTATGHDPYQWQRRLADDPACRSRLIDIPTGLGKTAGVVLAWLWNRAGKKPLTDTQTSHCAHWPRRLVYCLPMRTLVEQTEGEVKKWLAELPDDFFPDACRPRVVVLMGGESPEGRDKDWDLYPEEPAVLIGTQDMLLSRALNRGYGMSRYRWPMHFALLNNDCLWVMDEVQLMGTGLASTTQLEGFRSAVTELGSQRCHSWWMSATIRPDWLKTIDMPDEWLSADLIQLSDAEKKDSGRVEALRTASKVIEKSQVDSGSKSPKTVAHFIKQRRAVDGINLVIVNTLRRARELYAELKKLLKGETGNILLLHSQFRPNDRQRVLDEMRQNPSGMIVVSTQVVEAGVDLSAHTLFTELAPWSSLVQRFGRCNRWLINGQPHYADACIYWFDLQDDKDHPPYQGLALAAARERLTDLSNAAIQHLEAVESPDADRPEFRHVIRSKDLVDLFDTTPDLAGADLDIDRFIRDAGDSHIRVFWRDWQGGPEKAPNGDENGNNAQNGPQRDELCSVSIGDFRNFIKTPNSAWRWNSLCQEWQKVTANDIYPGQVYLLHISQGGYDQGTDTLPTGWDGNTKSKVQSIKFTKSINTTATEDEAYDWDPASEREHWQTLAQHTDEVCRELNNIINALDIHPGTLPDNSDHTIAEILSQAARWHDWGKSHPAFQSKLIADCIAAAQQKGVLPSAPEGQPVAKAPEAAWAKGRMPRKPAPDEPRRKHFRHELASALGILHPSSGFPLAEPIARDLAAYLVAAHHGKVRLSIRSLPDEWIPPKDDSPAERRFARGVWDKDTLPDADLGGGIMARCVTLSLEPMELGLCQQEPFIGEPSWAERSLNLRDRLGPFALAYLEAILRAADARASMLMPDGCSGGGANTSTISPKTIRILSSPDAANG